MKKFITLLIIVVLLPACAMQYKKTEEAMRQPTNCATAEDDIRMLEQEKTNLAQHIVDIHTTYEEQPHKYHNLHDYNYVLINHNYQY